MPRFRYSLSGAPVLAGALLIATGSTPCFAQAPARPGVARISDAPVHSAGEIQQTGLCRHTVSYNSASPTPVVHEGWTRGCYPNYNRCMNGGACMSRRCACLNGYGPGPAFVQPKVYPQIVYDRHYNQWWPGAWTGQPGVGPAPVFPMVYQPTDTTQMGFYSLHVPYWSSHPGILPPPPVPNWPVGGVYSGMGANYVSGPMAATGPGLMSRLGGLFRGWGTGANNGMYDGTYNGMSNGYDPNCPPDAMNTNPPGAAPIPQAQPQPAPAQPAPVPEAQPQPAPEAAPAPPEAFFPQRQLQ